MRDHNGFLICGVMGSFKDMTHFQAQLWAVHMGMKEAFSRSLNKMLIETERVESFRILCRQDFDEAASREEERNKVARFGANYDMLHHSGLVEVDYSFQPMRDLLDNDIGWGPHLPALDTQPNFGQGELEK
ncbi:hypothetical protein POM88_021358 [Heracleum sosnowskyi]|uniref:RNase H type-1 domain-containing protein n=1 Tax=Heracleum sosnowskyi TaxID=360622 RepID=A0AAD8IFQ1_9APIA|nr:hypothetical protein POM88_021358 [Heracleum sosnowskyi]